MTDTSPSLRTEPSLLARLHDWEDAAAWNEFHRRYRKLIFGLARSRGLTPEEAEEVTQDVLREVAQRIETFEHDPARGKFRGWLMNLTRWRVSDKLRQRPRHEIVPVHRASESDTATAERVPAEDQLAAGEEAEWQRHVLDLAWDRLSRQVDARHLQAFQLYKLQHWEATRVATSLGLTPQQLHVISHRLTRRLQAHVERLRRRLG